MKEYRPIQRIKRIKQSKQNITEKILEKELDIDFYMINDKNIDIVQEENKAFDEEENISFEKDINKNSVVPYDEPLENIQIHSVRLLAHILL